MRDLIVLALTAAFATALGFAIARFLVRQRRRGQPAEAADPWGLVFRQLLLAAPIRVLALILGGPSLQAGFLWTVWIVWRGGWEPALQGQQLAILGWALMGQGLLWGVVLVALAAVQLEVETKIGKLSVGGGEHEGPLPGA